MCEEGSIARAAVREALVASALSKRLSALEKEVGVPLLLRRRRGIQITPAGEALLARSRELLAALARVRGELGAFGQGVQGSVRVLASPSVLAEQLPEDIASFLALHPALRISLDERTSPDIVRKLRDGTADLGVLWDFADLSGLHCVPYRNDHLCAAMPPSHPWSRRKSLNYIEMMDEVSVGVAPGGLMDQLLRRQAALIGRTPSYRIQVSSMDAACRIIAAGLGMAVLPREAVLTRDAVLTRESQAGAGRLSLVPLADAWAVRRFVVATRPEPLRSASARLLAEQLQAMAVQDLPQRTQALNKTSSRRRQTS